MIDDAFITLDFETFYDRVYSLSKLTTEEYVRDPRFEVIGVGVKVGNHPTDWFSGSMDETRDWLHSIDWSNKKVLAHNTLFDGAILSWHFGIRPKLWLDTLSMARPIYGTTTGCSLAAVAKALGIGEKGNEVLAALGKRRADFTPAELAQYGRYCKNDVDLCRDIFEALRPQFSNAELLLIDQTIRMFTEPVLELDNGLLINYLHSVREGKAELLRTALKTAFTSNRDAAAAIAKARLEGKTLRDMLMSNDIFAELLRSAGVEPPMKTSLRTGKEAYAFAKTDKEFTALQEHEDPTVQALVSARLGVKSTIEETRAERFVGLSERGAFPIPLNYSGAFQTWRWSGADKLNLQNLPRGGTLRHAIRAPEGYAIVAVDSSNIELRVNHTLAGQLSSVESFRAGRDLYCEFASVLFGRPITKADKNERQLGKLCIAEGELVLTDHGLVPIEEVTLAHRVWDGVEWVTHDGAVLVGEKEVITHDGVTATPDHMVYLRNGDSCQLREAAETGSHLAQTGVGGQAIRLGRDFDERAAQRRRSSQGTLPLHRLRQREVGEFRQLDPQEDSGVSGVFAAQAGAGVAHEARECDAAALHKPERPLVRELRGAGHQVPVRQRAGSVSVGAAEPRATQGVGAGSHRQQWPLCTRQLAVGDSGGEYEQHAQVCDALGVRDQDQAPGGSLRRQHAAHAVHEVQTDHTPGGRAVGAPLVQTKRRVWDILNAGPRHRFTVSGRLVSNCHLSLGYGCGWQKFQHICRLNKVALTDEEAQRIVKLWRDTYSMIPKFWRAADAALPAIHAGVEQAVGPSGLILTCGEGLRTPPQHMIRYAELRRDAEEGWTYLNRRQRKKVYGGAVVENICQHIARNIIADQWVKSALWCAKNAPEWRVVLQVHDEIVLCGPARHAELVETAVVKIMSTAPAWWPEVPLAAEGGIGETYGDAH